jgi:lipopolysaccharide transport system ATP-binding protein
MEVDTDIMLIDEMLSVGDGHFQKKSGDALMGRLNSGKTGIVISHDVGTITRLCSRAIWIENGVVLASGDTDEVAKQYGEALTTAHPPTVFAAAS